MSKQLPTLYKLSSTGKPIMWEIGAHELYGEARYETVHGQVGGKTQLDTVKVLGKNIGRANETTPYEQAISEATSKWNKQKDKGYVESIDLLPTSKELSFKPMLAHKWSEQFKKATFPGFMQPKLDGIRCVAYKEAGEVILMSRGNKKFTTLSHLQEQLSTMPTQLAFDGEIYNPDITFQKINSYLKRLQEDTKLLNYSCYDLIEEGPFSSRYTSLLKELPKAPNLFLVQTDAVTTFAGVKIKHDEYVALGYEGGMWRNAAGLYKNSKSYDLLKVKEFDDDEFEIIGSYDGVGRDEGVINFTCKLPNGVTVDVPMIGEKENLKQMWLDRDSFVGKMLTVKFFGYTDSDPPSLRFPKGKSIRENGQ